MGVDGVEVLNEIWYIIFWVVGQLSLFSNLYATFICYIALN
jgi:hypothetical protein